MWVVLDGHVQARSVKLGLRTLDAAEVLQGLEVGDTVLLGASPALRSRVRADTAAGPAALSAARAGGGSDHDVGSALSNAMGR